MGAASDYLEAKLLDHVLTHTSYTSPTTVYAALFTSSSSLAALEAGTITNEVSGGSYARQAITFAPTSGGSSTTTATLTWTNMPAGSVAYIAVMDASSSGNVLFYGALSSAKTLTSGDTFTIATANLTAALD